MTAILPKWEYVKMPMPAGKKINRPHWKEEAAKLKQQLAATNTGMPDPADFVSSDGTFLNQLFAAAVLRRLSDKDRAAVLKQFK